MTETPTQDPANLTAALAEIRKRRRYLWLVILVYLPAMWGALRISPTYRTIGTVFFVWIILLFAVGIYSALARCPRCGNYFHMHGMTLLYLRKCLHCQLHISADKRAP